MFAFQVATAVVAEEESNNQGRKTEYRGSILDHNIVNRNRKKDLTDEYLRIGETTAIESLRAFVKAIVEVFGDWYLRAQNEADVCRLLSIGEQRGFPRMLGSIDCGGFTRSLDMTCLFGMSGSLNNINVLDQSLIFAALVKGRTTPVNYTINGHEYTMGYYLADEIYPNWSTFVKTISRSLRAKTKYFASKQESAIKDVERAFGVLQSRFAICHMVKYHNYMIFFKLIIESGKQLALNYKKI
ncbi:uncharacterized protein LOC112326999 [Populus trichocarpa]|uniref:uncharacterized protein LOC112326999 n=1 Tax=Populus trichocarpa TaxID=3694 RepID=UPI002278D709|nr:uncharacterized protein LOC112326999 [Populus trichocarpa]